jgi:hypothetical protein
MNFKILLLITLFTFSFSSNEIDFCKQNRDFAITKHNSLLFNPWEKYKVESFLKSDIKDWVLFKHIGIWNDDPEIQNLIKKRLPETKKKKAIDDFFSNYTKPENKIFYKNLNIQFEYIPNISDPYHYILTGDDILHDYLKICTNLQKVNLKVKKQDFNFFLTLLYHHEYNDNKSAFNLIKAMGYEYLFYYYKYKKELSEANQKHAKNLNLKFNEFSSFILNKKIKSLEYLLKIKEDTLLIKKIKMGNEIALEILKTLEYSEHNYITMVLKSWILAEKALHLNEKYYTSYDEFIKSRKIIKASSSILIEHYFKIRNSNIANNIDIKTSNILLKFVDPMKFKK